MLFFPVNLATKGRFWAFFQTIIDEKVSGHLDRRSINIFKVFRTKLSFMSTEERKRKLSLKKVSVKCVKMAKKWTKKCSDIDNQTN